MNNHPLTPRRNRVSRVETRAETQSAPIVPLWAVLAFAIVVGFLALI